MSKKYHPYFMRDVFMYYPSGKSYFLCGGSLPLATAAYGVFRYPLCGALPRNAPEDSASRHPIHNIKNTLSNNIIRKICL
jgi:hypothetical protein